jgi:hypothetical protein
MDKFVRNEKNEILCPIHKITKVNFCLNKHCKNQINCRKCVMLNIHNNEHAKDNMSIDEFLNQEFVKEICEEKNINIDPSILEIKKMTLSLKKNITDEIDQLELRLIEFLRQNLIFTIKQNLKEYNEKLERFKSENCNLSKFVEVAESFWKLIGLENKDNSPLRDYLNEIKKIIIDQETKLTKCFEPDSLSLFYSQEQKFIQNLFENKIENFRLLYRGSRDGFTSKTYHLKCDDKKNNLIIIKSDRDKIFGGYISIPINGGLYNNSYWRDDNAFLFSLEKKLKFACRSPLKAIQYCDTALVSLGEFSENGRDLCINDNCNVNSLSYSNLGKSYHLPYSIPFESEEAQNVLAGTYKFMVKEIEVYELDFVN